MEVKINPTGVIKARLGINDNGRVQRYFQNKCYEYMDKYVPLRENNLRTIVDLSDPHYIVYESPYARYQYYGKLMVMDNGKGAYYSPTYGFWSEPGKPKHLTDRDLVYHTPGTGPFWDKEMVSAEFDDLVKEVQDYIIRGGR